MSKRLDGLYADYMDNRWTYTDSQVNATISAALVAAPQSAKEQRHLDYLSLVAVNKTAGALTVTVSVRDVSPAGTVLAQWPLIMPTMTTTHIAPENIHLVATIGKGLIVTQDTVVASVVVAVNAGGWTNQSEN